MSGINKEEATKKNKTEQGSSLLIEFSAGSLVLCFDIDTFNPIESAVMNAAQATADTHAAPEYRSAFYKRLLGKEHQRAL